MTDILSKQGLIAIGGKSKDPRVNISIHLANEIASNEKVLFLNWGDYEDKLTKRIEDLGNTRSKNLILNTEVGFFDLKTFLYIAELINSTEVKTVFFDSLNESLFLDSSAFYVIDYWRNLLIKTFLFIIKVCGVRVIFSLDIEFDHDSVYSAMLKDFSWSSTIRNDCDQILVYQNLDKLENSFTDTPPFEYTIKDYCVRELKNDSLENRDHYISFN